MNTPSLPYLQGKLCLREPETGRSGQRRRCHRMSQIVTTPVSDVSVMSEIEAQLRQIETARGAGAERTAEAYTDRLIDYVWGSAPDGAA